MTHRRHALAALAAMALPLAHSQDASWPSKAITLVLPFPAGGQTDAVARVLARSLETALGQPVVVDNRPGANSLIGSNLVARAAPDGHTLLLNMTALVSNPILLPNISYEPLKDFAPVARLYEIAAIWAVPPNGPKTLAEFVAKAKAAREPLNFATTGHASSSHFFGEVFSRAAGIQLNHVPYKGEAPILPDLLGGRLDAAVVSSATAVQYGRDNRLRALATSGRKRWKALPELPTFLELGIPGMTTESFAGIFAPARTPAPVIARLHETIARVTDTAAFKAQLLANGLELAPALSTEQFLAVMRRSQDEWTEIKKQSLIKVE